MADTPYQPSQMTSPEALAREAPGLQAERLRSEQQAADDALVAGAWRDKRIQDERAAADALKESTQATALAKEIRNAAMESYGNLTGRPVFRDALGDVQPASTEDQWQDHQQADAAAAKAARLEKIKADAAAAKAARLEKQRQVEKEKALRLEDPTIPRPLTAEERGKVTAAAQQAHIGAIAALRPAIEQSIRSRYPDKDTQATALEALNRGEVPPEVLEPIRKSNPQAFRAVDEARSTLAADDATRSRRLELEKQLHKTKQETLAITAADPLALNDSPPDGDAFDQAATGAGITSAGAMLAAQQSAVAKKHADLEAQFQAEQQAADAAFQATITKGGTDSEITLALAKRDATKLAARATYEAGLIAARRSAAEIEADAEILRARANAINQPRVTRPPVMATQDIEPVLADEAAAIGGIGAPPATGKATQATTIENAPAVAKSTAGAIPGLIPDPNNLSKSPIPVMVVDDFEATDLGHVGAADSSGGGNREVYVLPNFEQTKAREDFRNPGKPTYASAEGEGRTKRALKDAAEWIDEKTGLIGLPRAKAGDPTRVIRPLPEAEITKHVERAKTIAQDVTKRIEAQIGSTMGEVAAGRLAPEAARKQAAAIQASVLDGPALVGAKDEVAKAGDELAGIAGTAMDGFFGGRMSLRQARSIIEATGHAPEQSLEMIEKAGKSLQAYGRASEEAKGIYSQADVALSKWDWRTFFESAPSASNIQAAVGVIAANAMAQPGMLDPDKVSAAAQATGMPFALAHKEQVFSAALDAARAEKQAAVTEALAKYDLTDEQVADIQFRSSLEALTNRPRGWKDALIDAANQPGKLYPFIGDLIAAKELVPVAVATLKAGKGIELNPTDEAALGRYVRESGRDATTLAGVVDVVSVLPGFMLELMATAGVSEGISKGVGAAGRWALTEVMSEKAAEKALQKFTESTAKRMAGKVIGITAQTPLAFADKIAADVFKSTTIPDLAGYDGDIQNWAARPGMEFGPALGHATFDAWAENLSENSGAVLMKGLTKALGPMLPAVRDRMMRTAWVSALAKTNPGKMLPSIGRMARQGGFHGILEEMLEERFGEAVRGIGYLATNGAIGEEYHLPTAKQLATELMSFAVPGGFFGIINARSKSKAKRNNRASFEAAVAPASAFGDWRDTSKVAAAANDMMRGAAFDPLTAQQLDEIEDLVGPVAELPTVRHAAAVDDRLAARMYQAEADEELTNLGRITKLRATGTAVTTAKALETVLALRTAAAAIKEDAVSQDPALQHAAAQLSALTKISQGRPAAELTPAEMAALQVPTISGAAVAYQAGDRMVVTDAGKQEIAKRYGSLVSSLLPASESAQHRKAQSKAPVTQSNAKPAAVTQTAPGAPVTQSTAEPAAVTQTAPGAPVTQTAPGAPVTQSNAKPAAAAQTQYWTGVGEAGTFVRVPAGAMDEAAAMAALASALPLGESLDVDSVLPPAAQTAPGAPVTQSNAKPATTRPPAHDIAGDLQQFTGDRGALSAADTMVRRILASIPTKAFPGGVEYTAGIRTGMEYRGSTGKLLVNLDQLVGEGEKYLKAGILEEVIHSAAVRALDRTRVEELWRSLPQKLKAAVLRAYQADYEARKETPPALDDFVAGHEFLRMVVQDRTFRGMVSEAVEPNATWPQELIAFLRELATTLKELIAGVDGPTRAMIEEAVGAVNTALAELGITTDTIASNQTAPVTQTAPGAPVTQSTAEPAAAPPEFRREAPPENRQGPKPGKKGESIIQTPDESADAGEPVASEYAGKTTVIYTSSGEPVTVQWAIVDIDEIITSNLDGGALNPEYDQRLQGRDRRSAASQVNIQDIASNTTFGRLSVSADTGSGAPIVSADDGMVESGNGRAMGIRLAYKEGRPNVQKYRAELEARAQEFGIDPAIVQGIRYPVLIRLRLDQVDREAFVDDANRPGVARRAPKEVAMADASLMTPAMLSQIDVGMDGNLYTPKNDEFFRSFFGQAVTPAELPDVIDESGGLTVQGLLRIRNALFISAYGSSPAALQAFEQMAEDPAPETKNMVAALVAASPLVARHAAAVEAGTQYDAAFPASVTAAMGAIMQGRREKLTPAAIVSQAGLFDDMAPLTKALITYFGENSRSGQRMALALRNFAFLMAKAGDPRQTSLFGDDLAPDVMALWKLASSAPDSMEARDQEPQEDNLGAAGRQSLDGELAAALAAKDALVSRMESELAPDYLAAVEDSIATGQPPKYPRLSKPSFPSPGLDRADRILEARFFQQIAENEQQAIADYQALSMEDFGTDNYLNSDLARGLLPEYREHKWVRTIFNDATVAPAGYVVLGLMYPKLLQDAPTSKNSVLLLAGGPSSGKTTAAKLAFAEVAKENAAIVDSVLATMGSYKYLIDMAVQEGFRPVVAFIARPFGASAAHSLKRLVDTGLPVDVRTTARMHYEAQRAFFAARQAYSMDAVFHIIANDGGLADIRKESLEYLEARSYYLVDESPSVLEEEFRTIIDGAYIQGRITSVEFAAARYGNVRRPSDEGLQGEAAPGQAPGGLVNPPLSAAGRGLHGQGEFDELFALDGGSPNLPSKAPRFPTASKEPPPPDLFGFGGSDLFGQAIEAQGSLFSFTPSGEADMFGIDESRPTPPARLVPRTSRRRPGSTPSGLDQNGDLFGAPGPSDLFAGEGGQSSGGTGVRTGQPSSSGGGRSLFGQRRPSNGHAQTPDAGGGNQLENSPPANRPKPSRNRPKRQPAEIATIERPENPADRNFEIPDGFEPSPGKARARIEANFEAIALLRALETESRNPTPAEKAVLVRYSGWGAFGEGFADIKANRYHDIPEAIRRRFAEDPDYKPPGYYEDLLRWNKRYGDLHRRLKSELTEDEYLAARKSIRNAHYTAAPYIDAMWKMAEKAGFRGGRVLEPGAGAGHFAGRTPAHLRDKVAWDMVELDDISAKILSKLYPEARVNATSPSPSRSVEGTGFQNVRLANNSFDLVISNFPFATEGPGESVNEFGIQFNLHNYFFARALAKAKPGGLVVAITTHYTADAQLLQRQWLAQHAELIQAIRLPSNAFKENAGTEVVTDILMFRKPTATPHPAAAEWVNLAKLGEDELTKTVIDTGDRWKAPSKAAIIDSWREIDREWIPKDSRLAVAFAEWNDSKRPATGKAATALILASTRLKNQQKSELAPHAENAGRLDVEFTAPIYASEYFRDHPLDALGTHALTGTMYGPGSYNLEPYEGGPERTAEALAKAIERTPAIGAAEQPAENDPGLNGPDVEAKDKVGTFVFRNGRFWQVGTENLIPTDWTPAQQELFVSWDKLKVTAETLVSLELENGDEAAIEAARKALNEAYDLHVIKHGHPAAPRANPHAFLSSDTSGYSLVQSLEEVSKDVGADGKAVYRFDKAPIFRQRTLSVMDEPEAADGVIDALGVSLGFRGTVDIDWISDLTGTTTAEARKALLASGAVFEDPITGQIILADHYLSGNVGRKLAEARDAAEDNPAYQINVEKLLEVQPTAKAITEIGVSFGSKWIPGEVYTAFVREVLLYPAATVAVTEFSWDMTGDRGDGDARFISSNWDGAMIARAIASHKPIEVYHPTQKGETRRLNVEATEAAKLKAKQLVDEFRVWVQTSPTEIDGKTIGEITAEAFNTKVNLFQPPTYKGDWIRLPDQSGEIYIENRPHRKAVLARMLVQGFGMMAHGVGSGKTYNLIALAHELKRLGRARKPVIVVQNSTIAQFAASYRKAYPQARLLIANTKGNFQKANRAMFYAQMATGDWDAIIMPHSAIDQIPHTNAAVLKYGSRESAEMQAALARVAADSDSAKRIQAALDAHEERMKKMLKKVQNRQDSGAIPWEKLGVDALLVDEAHAFKNTPVVTKRERVKNMPTGDGSDRAISMQLKVAGVQERNGGQRGVYFATGTPVTNTMAEVYVMLRFIAPGMLVEQGIHTFDDFADTFAEVTENPEGSWKGTVEMTARLAKFRNGSVLINLIRSVFDVALGNEALGLDVPRIKGGRPEQIILPPTSSSTVVNDWMLEIADEWEMVPGRFLKENPEFTAVPILTMFAGVAAALDPRMVAPNLPDAPGSKVNVAVKKVLEIYKAGANRRTTQAIFTDLRNPFNRDLLETFTGQGPTVDPDQSTGQVTFDLYKDIKEKLMAGGVKEGEIWWPPDSITQEALEEVFKKINSGEIRIVIGSTSKLGVGVNMQERLAAVHHLMPPRDMKPAMMEQRNGRIIRQGNLHFDWAQNAFTASIEKVAGRKFEGTSSKKRRKAAEAWLSENGTPEHRAAAEEAAAEFDIQILEYAVENSLDSAIFSMMSAKQGFIAQALSSVTTEEEFADPADEIQMGMAEMAARTMGDPDMIRMVELERIVREMRAQYAGHASTVAAVRDRYRKAGWEADALEVQKEALDAWGNRHVGMFDGNKKPVWVVGSKTIDPNVNEKDADGKKIPPPPLTGTITAWLDSIAKKQTSPREEHPFKVGPVEFRIRGLQRPSNDIEPYGLVSVQVDLPGNNYPVELVGAGFNGAKSLILRVRDLVGQIDMAAENSPTRLAAAKAKVAALAAAVAAIPQEYPGMEELRNTEADYLAVRQRVTAAAARMREERQARRGGNSRRDSEEARQARASARAAAKDSSAKRGRRGGDEGEGDVVFSGVLAAASRSPIRPKTVAPWSVQGYFDFNGIPPAKQEAAQAAIAAAAAVPAKPYKLSATKGTVGIPKRLAAERSRVERAWRGLTGKNADEVAKAFAQNRTISSLVQGLVSREIPSFDVRGAIVKSAADFAMLNMALRTPFFESIKVAVIGADNTVIHSQIVHVGSVNETVLSQKNVLGVINSAKVANPGVKILGYIIAHNHPSGETVPSNADTRMTQRLRRSSEVADIPLLDHVITNGSTYYSYAMNDWQGHGKSNPLPTTTVAPWEVTSASGRERLDEPAKFGGMIEFLKTADPGYHHAIYLDGRLQLRAVERLPINMNLTGFQRALLDGAIREGATAVAIGWGGSKDVLNQAGFHTVGRNLGDMEVQLLDVLMPEGPGMDPYSLRESGLINDRSPSDLAAAGRGPVRDMFDEAGMDTGFRLIGENYTDFAERQAEEERRRADVAASDNLQARIELQDARRAVNTSPSEAQKEAGNYAKGHVTLFGLPITIENPKGSERSGRDANGKAWSILMAHDYGYIKGTTGKDGDHVDVFIGPDLNSSTVFVVNQIRQDGKGFDEHKAMLGFSTKEDAIAGYRRNYQPGWKVGPVVQMTVGQFRAWAPSEHARKLLTAGAVRSLPEASAPGGTANQGLGKLQTGGRQSLPDSEAILEAAKELAGRLPSQALREKIQAEPKGLRSIGNPEIAGYAQEDVIRREIDAVRVTYESQFKAETMSGWVNAARDMIAKDRTGVQRALLEAAREGRAIESPELVKAAQLLIPDLYRQALATRDEQGIRDAQTLALAYSIGGTETARALAARRDPFKTPAERHAEFLGRLIAALPSATIAAADKAPTPAEKSRSIDALKARIAALQVNELPERTRLRKQLDALMREQDRSEILAKAQNDRLKAIEDALEGMGVTLHDIFSNQAVVRIRGSVVVTRVLETFTKPERAAILGMINGASNGQIKKATGIPTAQIPNLEARFRSRMMARFEELARRGITITDFLAEDAGVFDMSTRIAKDGTILSAAGRSAADVKAAAEEMMKALLPTAKARNSTRVKKLQPAPAPTTTQTGPPPVAPPVPGPGGSRWQIPTGTRFNPASPIHVAQVARLIRTQVDSNGFDMAFEYWINGILSGPATHAVNILGNAAHTVFEYGIQRWMEAALNTLIGSPGGASFKEYGWLAKLLPTAWAPSWKHAMMTWGTEESFLETDLLRDPLMANVPLDKLGGSGSRTAIPGSLGRFIRIPGRLLLFMDTLMKSVIAHMEVGAQAYRIATAEQLTGAAKERRIRGMVNLKGSEAWIGAVEKARELTFTAPLRLWSKGGGLAESMAARLQRLRSNSDTGPVGSLILGMIFPFIQTPFNVFRSGLRRTPLGLGGIASSILRSGLYSFKHGRPFFESYSKARLARDLTDQTIAWVITGLLLAISEGDDDDDDKPLLLTGSRPYGIESTGERDLLNRTEGGPFQIRFGKRGAPGTWYWNYGRTEPAATTLATVSDMVRGMKRAGNGQPPAEELQKVLHYAMDQAQDKTFLRGIATIYEYMTNPDEQTAGRAVVTALVPNIIRQPLRNIDNYSRNYKTAPWYYHAMPLGGFAEPAIDIYGNPIRKDGSPIGRLISPSGIEPAAPRTLADTAMVNWNRKHPQEPYTPARNRLSTAKDVFGVPQPLTPAQITEISKRGGRRMAMDTESQITPFEASAPTAETIAKIQKARASAFTAARDEIAKEPPPPARQNKTWAEVFGLNQQ